MDSYEAKNLADVINENSQHKVTMELKDTADEVAASYNENIVDQKKSIQIKETLQILNVELVAPANVMPVISIDEVMSIENTNTESQRINEWEKEEHKGNNNGQKEADDIIEIESNIFQKTIEEVDNEQSDETPKIANTCATTGLSLLAQYDSDNDDKTSDSESVIEVPVTSNQDYRNQVVEINSDTDSDDSGSDVECLKELRKTIEKRIEAVDDDEEEDESDDNEESTGKKNRKPKLKVKGELLLEDLPPIHDLKITVPEEECIEFGKIHSIVDQLVLVSVLPNSILLDLETVLFLEKGRKVLGEVFDVLGQVADPLYCVRFNSNKQIKEKEINVDDIVFVAPKTQYTQYVILSNLMQQKGSDASWKNDIEPPPKFLDYSDDEQEQFARRQLRNKDRPVDNDDPTKRSRTNEDDDDILSVSGSSEHLAQHRAHHSRKRGGSMHYNSYSRPHDQTFNQYNQRQQNYHRGSWHSNYYRQYPDNYGMHTNQAYPPQFPMYPMQNMPYNPPLPTPYGAPPHIMHFGQMMPNAFSVRPATLQGPPISHVPLHPPQQYSSSPPPPPGSQ